MEIIKTDIDGVLIIKPRIFGDERGYFFESYNLKELKELAPQIPEFVQDNQSYSTYGVLRGLHFQKAPYAQAKLLRVVSGKSWTWRLTSGRGRPLSESMSVWS